MRTLDDIKKQFAENSKKYRDRKREQMGDVEYKKMMALKQKKQRAKTKIKKGGNLTKNDIETLDEKEFVLEDDEEMTSQELFEFIKKNDPNKKASDNTVRSNIRTVGLLKEFIFELPRGSAKFDLSFLKDVDTVINAAKKKHSKAQSFSNPSIKAISAILRSFQNQSDEMKELYQTYRKFLVEQNKKIEEKYDEQKVNEVDKSKWMHFDDILKVYKDIPEDDLRGRALFQLYTNLVRRSELGQFLKLSIGSKKSAMEKSKDYNYLVCNKSGTCSLVILNHFKTQKTYGTQELSKINNDMKDAFKKYIKSGNFKDGDFLFGKTKNEPYSSFLEVSKLFKKYAGKNISVNLLRKSYASYMHIDGRNMSIKKLKEESEKMGHSVDVHMKYIKNV